MAYPYNNDEDTKVNFKRLDAAASVPTAGTGTEQLRQALDWGATTDTVLIRDQAAESL